MGDSAFGFESPFHLYDPTKMRKILDNFRNLLSASFLFLFFVIH